MSDALYLLPDAALALVLARMRLVGLDRARPDVFFFLYAWLLYSLATLYWNEQLLHFAVWIFAAAPLARASLVLCWPVSAGRLYMYLAMAAPLPAALALRGLGNATAELAAACIAASITGGIFLLASFVRPYPLSTTPSDLILWRGAGAYFLLLGIALPLPAAFAPSFYPLLLVASAAVWLALAWFIAPTPDAIFNLERLALTSMAPLRSGQGIGRAGNAAATVLPARNFAESCGARSRVGNPAGATFSKSSPIVPTGGVTHYAAPHRDLSDHTAAGLMCQTSAPHPSAALPRRTLKIYSGGAIE